MGHISPVVSDPESAKAQQCRYVYALLPPGKRMAKVVAKHVGVSPRTAEQWCAKYKWREFALRHDKAALERALATDLEDRERTHLQILRDAQKQAGRSLGPVIDKARDLIDLPSTKAIQKKGRGKGAKTETMVVPVNVGEHESAARVLKTVVQMTTALLGEPDGHVKVELVLPDWLTEEQLQALAGGGEAAQKVIKMIKVRGMYERDVDDG